MGNQPSSPSTPPAQIVVPSMKPCDLECQKQKDLANLKAALDAATVNKDTDPEGYEKARIAYYTLLKGQGWLAGEKNRIARDEISQTITNYTTEYNSLKDQQKTQGVYSDMMKVLKLQEQDDSEDNKFLNKQINLIKDKAETLNRLSQLGATEDYSSWLNTGIDALIVLLGLFLLYTLYSKMNSIKALVGFTNNETVSAMSGGRRS
jgi:hypothetical protein